MGQGACSIRQAAGREGEPDGRLGAARGRSKLVHCWLDHTNTQTPCPRVFGGCVRAGVSPAAGGGCGAAGGGAVGVAHQRMQLACHRPCRPQQLTQAVAGRLCVVGPYYIVAVYCCGGGLEACKCSAIRQQWRLSALAHRLSVTRGCHPLPAHTPRVTKSDFSKGQHSSSYIALVAIDHKGVGRSSLQCTKPCPTVAYAARVSTRNQQLNGAPQHRWSGQMSGLWDGTHFVSER